MRLFFFPEFENIQLIERFSNCCPNIDLPSYFSEEETNGEVCDVMKANVKLFYDKGEEAKVDDVVDTMVELGFQLVDRNPSMIISSKVDVPIYAEKDKIDQRCSSCGQLPLGYHPPKPIKVIKKTRHTKIYYNNRVIFSA